MAKTKTTTKKANDRKPAAANRSGRVAQANGKQQKRPRGKLSCLDAAAKVLAEAGQSMNCQQMIQAMAEKGYWKSPNGLTPHATLYAAIAREVKTKGQETRFVKTERGKFGLHG